MIAGHPIGQGVAERWLTDTCTLQSPDRTQASGYATVATGVPCKLVEDRGGPVLSTGVMPTVQQPHVYFKRSQTLHPDWLITVTSQSNRKLKIDSLAAPPEAPLQFVLASGIRS